MCLCFSEFIKTAGEKLKNVRLAKHFITFLQPVMDSIIQEHKS